MGLQGFPAQAQTAAAGPGSGQLWRKGILGVIVSSVPVSSEVLELECALHVLADMRKRPIQLHLTVRICVLGDCRKDNDYMLLTWGVDIPVVIIIDSNRFG